MTGRSDWGLWAEGALCGTKFQAFDACYPSSSISDRHPRIAAETASDFTFNPLATIRSPAGRSSFTTDLHATKAFLSANRRCNLSNS